jgi:hypothetical protein
MRRQTLDCASSKPTPTPSLSTYVLGLLHIESPFPHHKVGVLTVAGIAEIHHLPSVGFYNGVHHQSEQRSIGPRAGMTCTAAHAFMRRAVARLNDRSF